MTMAEIGIGHSILEPSAGMGAIVKVFHEIHGTKRRIDCFELMEKNRVELTKLPAVNIVGNDFLLAHGRYDRIIANPPFSKQQDVDHVNLMYGLLNAGGVLVSVMSPGWKFRENKKSQAFRDLVNETAEKVLMLPDGAFKESGTLVRTCIVKMRKVA